LDTQLLANPKRSTVSRNWESVKRKTVCNVPRNVFRFLRRLGLSEKPRDPPAGPSAVALKKDGRRDRRADKHHRPWAAHLRA